jgi:hypothetical protein
MSTSLQTTLAAEAHPSEGQFLLEEQTLNNNNNNNNMMPYILVELPPDYTTSHSCIYYSSYFTVSVFCVTLGTIKSFLVMLQIFFVLRKKNEHVSTLHVIHHGVMPMSVWFGVKFTPGWYRKFSIT